MKTKNYPYIIYLVTSTITNKSYVGITRTSIEKRFKQHINSAKFYKKRNKISYSHFHRALNKYGSTSWVKVPLYFCSNIKEACRAEKELIETYNTFRGGYNNTTGGEKHFVKRKMTLKQRKQISKMQKVKSRLVTNPLIGKKNHMFKIGKNHPLYGNPRSLFTKKKISKNHHNVSLSNNPNSKHIIFQDPSGNVYKCFGTSLKFCKKHKLPISTITKMLKNNYTPATGRCAGWKVWHK